MVAHGDVPHAGSASDGAIGETSLDPIADDGSARGVDGCAHPPTVAGGASLGYTGRVPTWLRVALLLLLGSPEAALQARAAHGIESMCRCLPADTACPATHRLAAHVLAAVAADDPDPDEALALDLGLIAHESCFRYVRQIGGGPARGWPQLEPTAHTRAGRAAQQAAWVADPVLAATDALRVARRGLLGYGGGSPEMAVELARWVARAREATR